MLYGAMIPKRAHTHNYRLRLVAKIAMMPKHLPLVRITDMTLDKRNIHTGERISNPNARMCVRAWIDHDSVDVAPRLVNTVDDGAFVVRLEALYACA